MDEPIVAVPSDLTARIRRLGRNRDVALGYSLIVVGIAIALACTPRSVHEEFVRRSSTNLDNLRHHPINVLVLSAFVLGSPAELAEIPLLIWAYGALQRWLGRGATVVTGVFGHVGATLFVAVLLATGVTRGLVSPAVSQVDDVGVSYGMAAVAALCTIRVARRWRTVYVTVLVGVLVAALLLFHTFTDVGHATAWCIGLALAVIVAAARRADGRSHVSAEPDNQIDRRAAASDPAPTDRPDGTRSG